MADSFPQRGASLGGIPLDLVEQLLSHTADTPTQLLNNRPNPQMKSQSSSDDDTTMGEAPKPKRQQVSRACEVCRRLHAACDNERPCSRCVKHHITDQCNDAPRKPRRKDPKNAEAEKPKRKPRAPKTGPALPVSNSPVYAAPAAMPLQQHYGNETDMSGMPAQQVIYQDSYGQFLQYPMTTSDWDSAYSSLFSVAADHRQHDHDPYQESPYMLPPIPLEPPHVGPSYPGAMTYSVGDLPPEGTLQYFWDHLAQLKAENRQLSESLADTAHQLASAHHMIPTAQELPPQMQRELNTHASLAGDALHQTTQYLNDNQDWYKFHNDSLDNIPVSVWKSSPIMCGNTLVEANEAFVQLLGIPVEVLSNGFSCHQMMTQACIETIQSGEPLCQRQWMRRTQVNTARGLRDVFMCVTPVYQADDDLYFVIHFLENS